MADHHRAELVVDALKMAAGRGGLRKGCIAHSDRGSGILLTRIPQADKGVGAETELLPALPGVSGVGLRSAPTSLL
ncbi:hypothetical protein GCM10010121_097940 [Streptomyces brasiliensis]|uniref:Transposase n=1 Tax=Streptomyces brasiliensis TaxID=1954 RepID=A0A917PDH7_9ACTN|nr:hypothetical protein GCM10010121_097940 [Streptomyces brasiliensis]